MQCRRNPAPHNAVSPGSAPAPAGDLLAHRPAPPGEGSSLQRCSVSIWVKRAAGGWLPPSGFVWSSLCQWEIRTARVQPTPATKISASLAKSSELRQAGDAARSGREQPFPAMPPGQAMRRGSRTTSCKSQLLVPLPAAETVQAGTALNQGQDQGRTQGPYHPFQSPLPNTGHQHRAFLCTRSMPECGRCCLTPQPSPRGPHCDPQPGCLPPLLR